MTGIDNNNVTDKVKKEIERIDNIPVLKPVKYLGIEILPHQYTNRKNRLNFNLNILCIGEIGIGKTTLIESLFNRKFDIKPCNKEEIIDNIDLFENECCIDEDNVKCHLKIIESVGYGEHKINKNDGIKVIVKYIEEQFERYLKEEMKIKRKMEEYKDTRIHCCLFFISPTGHGLRSIDIDTMKELSKRVNIIPIIAKADTTSKNELINLKSRIVEQLKVNSIDMYQFPVDDDTVGVINKSFNNIMPFAVIGSNDFIINSSGKRVRARKYPWGIVEVENEEHCDFIKMRDSIIKYNIDSLMESTNNILYENYRKDKLKEMKINDGDMGVRMKETIIKHQKMKEEELKNLEDEYRLEFNNKVLKKDEYFKICEQEQESKKYEIEKKMKDEILNVEKEISLLEEEKTRLLNISRVKGKAAFFIKN
uniref:Septin n=1 Tax=Parastrongyloides trichosuri TaxID=131310 RepID=A0A0N4Z728_PARTI